MIEVPIGAVLDRSRAAAAHGLWPTAAYGLSEAPTVVAIDPVGEPTGVSGRVLPHLDVAAFAFEATDDGPGNGVARRLPSGEIGELGLSAAPAGSWSGL